MTKETIRREFRDKFDGANMANDGGALSTKYIHQCEDFWFDKFDQLHTEEMKRLIKEIVSLKEPFKGVELADHDRSYIAAVDDVLALLTEK